MTSLATNTLHGKVMELAEVRKRFKGALDEIVESCQITEELLDKDRFRVYIATVWGNAVASPDRSGITEDDLPTLHDYLNEEITNLLGDDESVTSIYQYLTSKTGRDAMIRLQIGQQHQEFINYFARLILGSDPLIIPGVNDT